jgi:hypothetical protein
MTPPTIKEDGDRWTVENARPIAMRVAIGFIVPIVLVMIGWTMWNDALEHRWVMLSIRGLFALVVLTSARFSLFGAESLALEGGALVYRRGKVEERSAASDVERIEREGNILRVVVRGRERPLIVGAGLRQQPAAMQWLADRVQQRMTSLTGAKKGT